MDTDFKIKMSPSLALLTLLNLTGEKHEVVMINENVEKVDFDLDVDLIGITVTLDVLNRASEIAQQFIKKGIPVVAGGIHVSCDPDNCEQLFSAICVGPAERVWGKILEDVQNGELKSRYCDFENFTGEEVVSPKYKFQGNEKYLFNNVLTTSRGCQNRCAFCYNSSENCVHVRRPLDNVIADIKTINRKHIYFIDDNFISDIKYTYELLDLMEPLNLSWGCAITTNIYNHLDLLDRMVEVGCKTVFIGFESINSESIESVNKLNKVSEYENLINIIHGKGLMVNASMVFGLDGDRVDVFKNSVDWLVKMKIETLTSHILTPYPGTKLYSKMVAENRVTTFDLSKYNTSNVVFKPVHLTEEELKEGYLQVYKEFYTFKNIIKRMPVNKTQRSSFVMFNIFYRKYGWFFSKFAKVIPMKSIGLLAEKLAYRH